MPVTVALLRESLLAEFAGERSEAAMGARMVLGTAKFWELLVANQTLHNLIEPVRFWISS